jgi:hypothetical protein
LALRSANRALSGPRSNGAPLMMLRLSAIT